MRERERCVRTLDVECGNEENEKWNGEDERMMMGAAEEAHFSVELRGRGYWDWE